MSYINLNTPPPIKSYTYDVKSDHLEQPSHNQLISTESEVGRKINPEYENGSKFTPTQKKRIAAISAAGLSAIGAVGVAVASIATGMLPLLLLAIPIVGGGIGAALYAILKQKDFHSPKYREKVMKKITNASLEEIARDYSTKRIIGYKLLDRMAPIDPQERLVFYARFTKLMKDLEELQKWKQEKISAVNNKFNRETEPLQVWYNQRRTIAEQGRIINRQQDMLLWDALEINRHRNRGRVNPILGGLVVGSIVGNDLADMHERGALSRDSMIYGEKIGPWNKWRQEERKGINLTYLSAQAMLEKQFDEIKSITASA